MLLAVLSLMLVTITVIGVVGLSGMKASQAARFSAFDCDNRPGFCRTQGDTPQQKVRSSIFYSDRQEVFPLDSPSWKSVKSLGRHQAVLSQEKDVSVSIDLPKVDGADQSLLSKLSEAFRGMSLRAGPAIFGLPTPDHFSRSTVRAVLWDGAKGPHLGDFVPRLELSRRVALVTDSWAASDRPDFFRRVKEGETPMALAAKAIEGLYLPGKDVLMPTFDLVGLESKTRAFRSGFHQANHDIAYPGAQTQLR